MKIAVVGAGAAGCFCAIELKRRLPSSTVDVFEAGKNPLAKVAITGGGRCNLTNSFEGISSLEEAYPRGDKLMRRVFSCFSHKDTWDWFTKEGVKLVLQEDNCVFPASQDAMQIVNLFLSRMDRLGVSVHAGIKVESVKSLLDEYDNVVVTTGGSPSPEGFRMLEGLDLEMVPPVPSLFTFNLPDSPIRELTGTVVEETSVSLAGTKFRAYGPLLVTHWGMSGPAILKLSSYAARFLSESGYNATLLVNWTGNGEAQVRRTLSLISQDNPAKLVVNFHPATIPSRLWTYLVSKARIRGDARWSEIGSKGMNKLSDILVNDTYLLKGRGQFKEEFVTCGGVALSNIDYKTLECKKHPGLYFAGEVLDVDAITGGFNLQAAWSMGYRVAVSISEK
ncbi:MAG: aminoacetone oxidase family FAD-binding enzyme [Bacteroidales bacterium]|nr:aminoacetone oxidase family FAD-binding enzyme [Bacteroidales bacterium]